LLSARFSTAVARVREIVLNKLLFNEFYYTPRTLRLFLCVYVVGYYYARTTLLL